MACALVERRPGEVTLTDVGLEVARRAERVLATTRDLAEFARHRGRLLTGRMQLGVIPSIAPYVLPKILPVLQRRYPELRIELRETQTHVLIEELHRGALDVIMLALPADEAEIETHPAVRRSVPARGAGDRQPAGRRAGRAPTTSTCSGCCCWKRATACAIRRWHSARARAATSASARRASPP